MAKILIIEDDPLIQKMYAEKLAREGYEVDTASDGEIGISKIQAFLPDLVIVDIMMPKKNGIEVINYIKTQENLANTKIIVLSNLSENPDIEKAKSLGVNEYLTKSDIDPEDVSETVKKQFSN
jgi:two-component system alkaline phosphatase synthesis response regulator PhoP